MLPLPQIITVVSISVLTILAVVIGIEFLLLIKTVRQSIQRLNEVIDTTETTVNNLIQPIAGITAIIEGVKQSGRIVDIISSIFNHNKKDEPLSEYPRY